ncbi:MAG: pantoate--beta-alanine ligase [Puniceicoccales bacterium]|nr:pantoate--beta-alanine ligase [Puniceicoccales bacterium]
MRVIRSVREMQALAAQWRVQGTSVGFVPTMGCLHSGHFSLVDVAKKRAGAVVVSIFVNPVQFGPGEDYERYPRAEAADFAGCEAHGVDVVFAPSAAEMFPEGFSTYANEEQCSRGLCGETRPGHFRGVATVVLMLLNIVQPEFAVFGQKDAQQVAVLKKMVRDFFLPVSLVVAPIARDSDGLALSSRNRYLTATERTVAPELFAALNAGKVAAGGRDVAAVRGAVEAHLGRFPDFRIQYIGIVNATTMRPIGAVESGNTLLAVAVYLGATRLIDNILI